MFAPDDRLWKCARRATRVHLWRALRPFVKTSSQDNSFTRQRFKNLHRNYKNLSIKMPSKLLVKRISEFATLPTKGSKLAAGYDLYAAYDHVIKARGKEMVKTDLQIALPSGTYGRVAPRSGLAWKHSIDVGAGVIDEDYRGPLNVILFNFSDTDFEVKRGDRVAQLICEKIEQTDLVEATDLDNTDRGAGGFGSTGI